MDQLIFDTSVWINHLNGKVSKASILLNNYLVNAGPVFICPPILQEVLQGVRDEKKFTELRTLLLSLDILQLGETSPYLLAASLFRNLKSRGVTIRKSTDCLIAVYAIESDVELIHEDRDFDLIAKHSILKVKRI